MGLKMLYFIVVQILHYLHVVRSIDIRDCPLPLGAFVNFDFRDKNDSSGEK